MENGSHSTRMAGGEYLADLRETQHEGGTRRFPILQGRRTSGDLKPRPLPPVSPSRSQTRWSPHPQCSKSSVQASCKHSPGTRSLRNVLRTTLPAHFIQNGSHSQIPVTMVDSVAVFWAVEVLGESWRTGHTQQAMAGDLRGGLVSTSLLERSASR